MERGPLLTEAIAHGDVRVVVGTVSYYETRDRYLIGLEGEEKVVEDWLRRREASR